MASFFSKIGSKLASAVSKIDMNKVGKAMDFASGMTGQQPGNGNYSPLASVPQQSSGSIWTIIVPVFFIILAIVGSVLVGVAQGQCKKDNPTGDSCTVMQNWGIALIVLGIILASLAFMFFK